MKNPKFEQKLRENVVDRAAMQNSQPGHGIVLTYDKEKNTATVLMSRPGSELPGEIHSGVACPSTVGLQTAAPEPGRPCLVMFKDGTQSYPMITHFFNPKFEEIDYERQYYIKNDIPRFMLEL